MARALEKAQGNVSAAAKLLGVHRSFFYRRKGP
jgi:transcriptional regulator of acetoin/glycerol metabolism